MACEHPSNGDTTSSVNNPTNNEFRRFFESYQKTVNPLDPLPVKVGSHSIRDNEVDGEIIDWTLNLLQQKNCPSKLLAHLVSLILWEVKFCLSKDDADKELNRDRGFEPVKLMQLVTSKINHICSEYLNNQKFDNLCTELSFCNKSLHPVSVHAIRNGRRKMEDRHVVIQDLNTTCSLRDDVPTSYYAIFDGHAGTDAAFYSAAQLHMKCIYNSKFTVDPGQALKEAFLATDHSFVYEHEHERLKGGTTAVVILIRGDQLFTAWLGDSQAVLVKDGSATQLVNPHKPDRSDEKERISKLGGEVIFWDGAYRVNGQLAVSRAIGDAGYKPYVTAEPDMVSLSLDGNEDFLIIGCDGLWDTVSMDEASFIVLQYLHHETDISGLSGRLVQAAKQKGSLDNISVIVVFLRDPELIARRPLPPAPSSSPPPQVGPTMEEQQEEYDKLTAKWGWSEPQGGAVFNETPWQQDPVDGLHQQPQNPFGNGDDDEAAGPLHHPTDEELAAKWGWSEDSEVSSSADASSHGFLQNANWKDPEIEALEQEARRDLDSSIPTIGETSGFTEEAGLSAKWGWTEPVGEPDSTTTIGEPLQAVHFVATSVQPFEDDDRIGSTSQEGEDQLQAKWGWEDPAAVVAAEKLADADPEEVRREFEKVAAKWDRDLQQFETNPNEQPKSDFHLSSDGSTWDQTSGTPQPSGVDWNQYDEELSGQPSLIFTGQSSELDSAGNAIQQPVISQIEDLAGVLNGLPEAAVDPQNHMWASDENSVTFPPSNTSVDGMFVDEGIAGDEADFTSSAPVESRPDVVTANAAPEAEDPDFHWNLHAPEFEFRAKEAAPQEEVDLISGGERKLSATELLVRSSNDAELAVLLAAANDDPDEMELQDDQGLDLDPLSPRDAPHLNESKNDGAVEAEDSEDDWTFNDYRSGAAEQSKEESAIGEGGDNSSVVEAESENKIVENCSQIDCKANDLGDQLDRLTVEDTSVSQTIPDLVETQPPQTSLVDETQSCEVSSTDQVAEPITEPVHVPVETINTQLTAPIETSNEQETTNVVESSSPISDTAATIGSEPATVEVATAVGVAAAVVAASASAAKAKTTATRKPAVAPAKTTSTAAKTGVKETTKKVEPTPRRSPTEASKSTPTDASKPARPTQLSPLKKATPAQPTTTAKPTPAPRTTAPAKKPVTETASRPTGTSTTATKRVPSAPTSKPTPAKPATPSAARTTTTRTTTTASATTTTTVTSARRIVSAKPSTTPSRSAAPVNKPATNGDVKPKPLTATPRTPAKPAVNGVLAKSTVPAKPTPAPRTALTPKPAAPKPSVNGVAAKATTKPIAAKTTPSHATPMKSVANRTATPGAKPSGATAAPKSATKTKPAASSAPRTPKTTTTAEATPAPPVAEIVNE